MKKLQTEWVNDLIVTYVVQSLCIHGLDLAKHIEYVTNQFAIQIFCKINKVSCIRGDSKHVLYARKFCQSNAYCFLTTEICLTFEQLTFVGILRKISKLEKYF